MAKLYTFGCTFNVVKRDDCELSDMDLAYNVMVDLKMKLDPSWPQARKDYTYVVESIHPIMGGPEGGVDIEE